MPKEVRFTVNDELDRRLAALVARHNARNGTTLTLNGWILLQLQERGIAEDLATSAQAIAQSEAQRIESETAVALNTERNRLIALVT